jgi:hypothetical protein
MHNNAVMAPRQSNTLQVFITALSEAPTLTCYSFIPPASAPNQSWRLATCRLMDGAWPSPILHHSTLDPAALIAARHPAEGANHKQSASPLVMYVFPIDAGKAG